MSDAPMLSVLRHGACTGSGQAAPGVTGLLALAAMPTFALMALWTGLSDNPQDMFCMQAASPLSGMTVMYLLMSVFHLGPWLRLIAGRPHDA